MPENIMVAVSSLKRAMHREEMERFGDQLTWLSNPAEVPLVRLGGFEDDPSVAVANHGIALWMVQAVGDWSRRNNSALNWDEALGKYDLPDMLKVLLDEPDKAYAPGILAMSEIVTLVPSIATRDGLERSDWPQVAVKARKFAGKLAMHGTDVQHIILNSVSLKQLPTDPPLLRTLDPSKFKLDAETGLTTVSPIDDYIATTRRLTKTMLPKPSGSQASGVCVGLQVLSKNNGFTEVKSVYDDFWLSFCAASQRQVFERISDIPVPELAAPDPALETTVRREILKHLESVA